MCEWLSDDERELKRAEFWDLLKSSDPFLPPMSSPSNGERGLDGRQPTEGKTMTAWDLSRSSSQSWCRLTARGASSCSAVRPLLEPPRRGGPSGGPFS